MIPLLLALLACSQGPADAPEPAPEPAESAPSAEPAAEPAPAAEAAGPAWTAATIDQLQPQPGTHAVTVPLPVPVGAGIERALQILGAVVDAEATDPGNPWAIGHGMVARGPDMLLRFGQPGVDWLFSEYGERFDAQGHSLLRFPESRGTVRIEPHADLLLKTLTETGVSPDRVVQVGGQPHPVADLWRGSLLRTYLVPASNHSRYTSPDDVGWSLQGLAAWAPPGLQWVALDGTPMSMDELTAFGMAVLYQETRFLAESLRSGQPFQRQGQGVFRYTCGGAHLLQGVGLAVARGFGGERARQAMAEQPVLMLHRYRIESEIYRQAITAMPEHGDALTVQRLKFAGHYLESMSKLAAWGFWTPKDRDLVVLQAAANDVVDAADELKRRGLLDDLAGLRARDEQLYLDIVGDSAHAIDGLELATGRKPVRW